MKKKKTLALLVVMAILAAGCGQDSKDDETTDSTTTAGTLEHAVESTVTLTEGKYSAEKLDDSWNKTKAVKLELSGNSISGSGAGVDTDGSMVTITEAGTYVLSGTLNDGQIIVDVDSEDSIRLVLNGVDITCSSSAPIYIKSGNTIITLPENKENTVTDGAEYVYENDGEDEPKAAVFAKDDLTFNGAGSLTVNGNYKNGIQSKDDLKFVAGTYVISAVEDGIVGKDSVSVKDGSFTIHAGQDGMKSTNVEETDKGYIMVDGGSFWITAGNDGIHAENDLTLNGGSIDVLQSYEGLEGFCIVINDGNIKVAASDDGVDAAGISEETAGQSTGEGTVIGDMKDGRGDARGGMEGENQGAMLTINGGTLYVNAGGDGLDANGDILIAGGNVTVHGPENSGNGTLDYASECKITGGTFFGAGSMGMVQNPSGDSTQPIIYCQGMQQSAAAGTAIVVKDSSGGTIAEVVTEKTVQWYAVSLPEFKVGETYTVCVGDTETEITLNGILTPVG